jgi:hypothetical protein
MKHIFLFIAAISMGLVSSAQSFELLGANPVDTIYYRTDGFTVDAVGYVKNPGSTPISLDLNRENNNLATGHETNFCWGAFCYDPPVNFSQIPVTLDPGAIDSTYKVTLAHYGNGGQTNVTMTFVNTANSSDTIRHRIVYLEDPTSSVDNNLAALGYSLGLAGANPVESMAKLRVALPAGATANVVLTDLTGRTLRNQEVSTSGQLALSLSGLSSGIYMARLEVNGQAMAAIKLVKQ